MEESKHNPDNLSEYELARARRIQKNEAYLASLGLDSAKPKSNEKRKQSKKPTTPKQPQEASRRSGRIKRKWNSNPEEEKLFMLSFSRDDRVVQTVQQPDYVSSVNDKTTNMDDFIEDATSRSRRRKVMTTLPSFTSSTDESLKEYDLTDSQKQHLKDKQDLLQSTEALLEAFSNFLAHKDKISPANERNVLRQIGKLVTGQGIRYESAQYGWPEGCIFGEGLSTELLLENLVQWKYRAEEAESEWGRDRGNGWLLRHPLQKLYLFQQYCLEDFQKS
eukprot:Nitzschia sp. Nitz4//scaffold87_size112219//44773//45603//NITZ4_004071-RA/size112219-processed-gene-0.129-mRNA-1//-1//CDS//3329559360//2526//frame0